MSDDQYWKFGLKEIVCICAGLVLGAAFGLGMFFVKPAPPWWFLPLPNRHNNQLIVELDTWKQYSSQGGYDMFWVQSTWGWAIVAGIAGLVVSNVVLRKKAW